MEFNAYVNWLIENKKDFEIHYKNGRPDIIKAHLQNQFGENVVKTLYVSPGYNKGEMKVQCLF